MMTKQQMIDYALGHDAHIEANEDCLRIGTECVLADGTLEIEWTTVTTFKQLRAVLGY